MTPADRDVREKAEALIANVPDLEYPQRDVDGTCRREDREAPLWTEAGLYGRVGKEAARTILARIDALRAALSSSAPPAPEAEAVACVCGDPRAANVEHRMDGPCYVHDGAFQRDEEIAGIVLPEYVEDQIDGYRIAVTRPSGGGSIWRESGKAKDSLRDAIRRAIYDAERAYVPARPAALGKEEADLLPLMARVLYEIAWKGDGDDGRAAVHGNLREAAEELNRALLAARKGRE